MFVLVTGGSGSGKSMYAEQCVLELTGGDHPGRIYIATMQCWDEETRARIMRHRSLRAGKGFETKERYTDLAHLAVPEGCTALLECMSNLTANEVFSPEGAGMEGAAAAVMEGVDALLAQCANLVVVTNEIFSDGTVYDSETRRYQRVLGEINCRMAEKADRVIEVVAGCPWQIK